jgi:hypothetical protein
VFIGILDPNQGVTGKGLWKLQTENIEVVLFPHELAQKIRVLNAAFIRTQQSIGAAILSPKNGDTLKTYETGGKHAVRFKCLNPPASNNYLVSSLNGLCWPQPDSLREVEKDIWEIDAHFGSPGDHTLHIVTASDLGQVLVNYYWKVHNRSIFRANKLKGKVKDEGLKFLNDHWIGIPMPGLPKGFRSEASVTITIAPKPK